MPTRLRRWWTENLGGTILFTIRYGNKKIEVEQGKNAIELSSKVELEPTLQSIKKAVDNRGSFSRSLWIARKLLLLYRQGIVPNQLLPSPSA